MRSGASVRMVALGLAFGCSGGAGLLAEQSFEKLLGTLLGTSTPAGAIVLGTYFGGLTLGGWLYARRRGKQAVAPAEAFRTYAKLEVVIALACAVLATLFDRLVPFIVPLLRLGAGSSSMLFALRLVVSACWILPVTVPMGATFPAIVDALDVLAERARGAAVSAFYALNLAGAIAAAAVGPYLVLPRVGVDGALAVAALLDCAAAAVALSCAWAYRTRGASAAEDTEDEHDEREHDEDGREAGEAAASEGASERAPSTTPLLVVAALSGFVLFSLEVVWTHLIGAVLGGSVYAFGTMLAVVLSGLGLGAAISGVLGARFGRVPAYLPGAALAIAAVALLAGHAGWPEAPHELAVIGRQAATFAEAERARAVIAVRLLLAPATALGTVYPLVLRLDAFPKAHAGPIAGRMGAVNALACIAGALVTGFAGIPRLGGERMLLALAALCVLAAAAMVLAYASRRVALPSLALAAVLGVALFLAPPWDRLKLTSGEQVYFHRTFVFPETTLRFFQEDTHGGITTVVENALGNERARVLLTNGKFQGNDHGEMAAQDAFALAPMMFSRSWDDALVIGLGTARTAHVVATMGFTRVACAEIAPGIVDAARREFAHVNGGVLDRPNVQTVLEDARNFLLVDRRSYDLVTTEISSVWLAGATNLYSREFYHVARARLRPGGVMQQWIQLHHIGSDDLATVLATMRDAFPYVSLFVLGKQGVLVGTLEPQLTQQGFFTRLAAHASELGEHDAEVTVKQLHASRLLSPADVDAFVARHTPTLNSDKNRRLEYTTARYGFERRDRYPENLRALARGGALEPQPVAPHATGRLADVARALDTAAVRTALGLNEP